MIIGIDPGITGAFAVIGDSGNFVAVHDMPTMPKGKPVRKRNPKTGKMYTSQKKQIDPCMLYQLMVQYAVVNSNFSHVFLEQVSAGIYGNKGEQQPKQGVTSAFGFGDSFGVARTIGSLICGGNFNLVRPAVWKQATGLTGQEKVAALEAARKLFPSASAFLTRKSVDIGRADALMIAYYGLSIGAKT